MQSFDMIPPDRIRCHISISSKKRALEHLASLLDTQEQEEIDQGTIFDALLTRERLGTTGFGHGVAIPHGRIAGLKGPILDLITLESPIDFDSIDQQPVDILMAMVVPEESADTHIALLSQIADMLRSQEMREGLRGSISVEDAESLLKGWHPAKAG